MRGILVITLVLLAASALATAATNVDSIDISEVYWSSELPTAATVFPSLLDDPADLIFDNSAVLPFSTGPYPTGNAWVSFPLTNSSVTIHSLACSFDTTDPQTYGHQNSGQDFQIGDAPNRWYTNTRGSASDPTFVDDNRYPYNIPRPQCDAAQDFLGVFFSFARPATQFGVYLPCASNNCAPSKPIVPNDDNYQSVTAKDNGIDVYVLHAGDTFLTADRYTLKMNGFCPFVRVTDPAGIVGVVIRDNCALNSGPSLGFMDAYATLTNVVTPKYIHAHPGDVNNDGACNVVDLGVLAKYYDQTGLATSAVDPFAAGSWTKADFNNDGTVNVVDLGVLAKNYDWTGPVAVPTPEPMTLSLLAVGGLALIRRRK